MISSILFLVKHMTKSAIWAQIFITEIGLGSVTNIGEHESITL